MELLAERRAFRDWRARLWSRVRGERVLEVGVGTGKNIRYHPAGFEVTGIDISPRMLERARTRARRLGADTRLCLMDAQRLAFPDASSTRPCHLVSAPSRSAGRLRELGGVVRPGADPAARAHADQTPVIRELMHCSTQPSSGSWAPTSSNTERNVNEPASTCARASAGPRHRRHIEATRVMRRCGRDDPAATHWPADAHSSLRTTGPLRLRHGVPTRAIKERPSRRSRRGVGAGKRSTVAGKR